MGDDGFMAFVRAIVSTVTEGDYFSSAWPCFIGVLEAWSVDTKRGQDRVESRSETCRSFFPHIPVILRRRIVRLEAPVERVSVGRRFGE